MTTPARKRIPDKVKVAVLLRMLGLAGKRIEWSHEPALGLRAINDAGTDYDPGQHDPDFIYARTVEQHAVLTNKNNGTGRSDKGGIAHVKQLVKKAARSRARREARVNGEPEPVRPARKISLRQNPWPPKGERPLRSRSSFQRRGT